MYEARRCRETQECQVKEVLDVRGGGGSPSFYLLAWCGCSEVTWVREEQCGCEELVEKFWAGRSDRGSRVWVEEEHRCCHCAGEFRTAASLKAAGRTGPGRVAGQSGLL